MYAPSQVLHPRWHADDVGDDDDNNDVNDDDDNVDECNLLNVMQELADEEGSVWPVTLSMSTSGVARRMFMLEKMGRPPGHTLLALPYLPCPAVSGPAMSDSCCSCSCPDPFGFCPSLLCQVHCRLSFVNTVVFRQACGRGSR